MRVYELFGRPRFLKGFHGWMCLIWAVLIPISVFSDLRSSVPWLVLMSVWANFVGHFSSWQATRVEVRQDEMIRELDPVTETVEARMQRAAEDRLEEIDLAWEAVESDPDDESALADIGLWCGGCHTCYVREVLEASIPILLDAIRSGEFTLEEPAAEVMSNVHHFPGSNR